MQVIARGRHGRAGAYLLAALSVAACRQQAAGDRRQAPPAPAPASPPAGVPGAAAPAGVPGAAAPADAGADAPPEAPGAWIESPLYRLRVDGLRRCGGARGDGGAPAWLGVLVRVEATAGDLAISPRDFTLQKRGLILETENLDAPALAGCSPLLSPRELHAGQIGRGVLLFRLAPSFQAAQAAPLLSYRPTRWGGAQRVDVKLPACLGDCSEMSPKQTKRDSAPRPRKVR